MNKKLRFALASARLLLTAAIWGFGFVVVKDSLDYVGPVWMVAFRFTIATFVLTLVYAPKLKNLTKKIWIHGLLLGLYLGTAYILQTIGCNYTTAGKNAFLTTIYVFLVPLFAWPISKIKPRWFVILCALMSVCGIGLLALNPGDATTIGLGDILTLICGIFYAVHIVFTAKYAQKDDPILLTVLQFFFAALLSWIFAPVFDGAFPQGIFHGRVVASLLYLGIFSTLVCFVLQNVGLKYLPSAWAALLLSFESVFGVFFGCLILGEELTGRMILGCVLIFMAVVLAQLLPEIIDRKLKSPKSNC